MKLYKEVDASKELPEQTGMQYPAINKFGAWVLVVYNGEGIWGHEFQEQLSDGYVKYWLKETTLAEIIKDRITEEEIEEMAHNYAYKKRRGEYMNPAKRHRIQENFIAGAKAIMDKLKD
jgi:hypothetical protein